jgi:hypothetical protein
MSGSITLTNLAGYSMGIGFDEVSINIQKLTIKADSAKILVKDRIGHQIGRVDHELKQEYSISGMVNAAVGIVASTVGELVTLANVAAFGGISAGACFMDEPTLDQETGVLNKFDCKCTRYPDIPAGATQVSV